MADDIFFSLGTFINQVHRHMERNNEDSVEGTSAAILAENPAWSALDLDAPLSGGNNEERIFNALVTSQRIDRVAILPSVDVRGAEEMLRKAVPFISQVDMAMETNESEAERILTILRTSPTLNLLGIYLGSTADGTAPPLSKYLRESLSLTHLGLTWSRFGQSGPVAVSEAVMTCRVQKHCNEHQ